MLDYNLVVTDYLNKDNPSSFTKLSKYDPQGAITACYVYCR